MAKSFSHRDHWQHQQLKKLQRQEAKSAPPQVSLPDPVSTVHDETIVNGIIIPRPEEIQAAAIPKETRTEPIVGLRVWNVQKVNGKPYLRSTFKSDFVWPYRKALEQDIVSDAGIHAVKPKKDWNDGAEMWGSYFSSPWSKTMTVEELAQHYKAQVMGEVYLWGRVQEHTCGYLAQFAYPKRLWVSPKMDVLTWMELEHEYGVPCDTHDALNPDNWKKEDDDSYLAFGRQFFSYPAMSRVLKTQAAILAQTAPVQKADNSKAAGA